MKKKQILPPATLLGDFFLTLRIGQNLIRHSTKYKERERVWCAIMLSLMDSAPSISLMTGQIDVFFSALKEEKANLFENVTCVGN
jgi:hypothetical protein